MLESLWTPATLGAMTLPHRLVMAPMTRDRSTPDGVPSTLNAEYYTQRASHALIITEGTQPSEDGQGYLLTPGIHTQDQIEGWRTVTDAVHAADGRLFIQLMHVGRIAHPDNTPHGRRPVAPSAIPPETQMITASGPQPIPTPRALATEEVATVVEEFRHAAASAVAAGADGVEIHGANGYLVQQFLAANANQRTDQYGGAVENRIRFAVEVATAVADEIGADRTGLRISPGSPLNGIAESDTDTLYPALIDALDPLGLAYLHVMYAGNEDLLGVIRRRRSGTMVLNRAGADIEARAADVEDGTTDLVSVGSLSLANPDLPRRLRLGAELNEPDPATFYGGGEAGYTDYPPLT